jgi:hypothetical protein
MGAGRCENIVQPAKLYIYMYIATYLSVRGFEKFAYFGILLNAKNDIITEVETRLNNATRAYLATSNLA